jgi:2-oxoglutarate ferredoxin oxidoreductase subunit alpha
VFIALDQGIGQYSVTLHPCTLEGLEIDKGKRLGIEELAEIKEYRRYQVTDDGISPWAVPGTPGGMNLVTGNEHDEWGLVSTQPANRRLMMDKRFRKIERARDLFPRGRRGGVEGAKIGILSVGMVCGTVREAVERLRARGLDIEILEPRTIWPVLEETLEFIGLHIRTYVVELNYEGQLARIMVGEGAPAEKIQSIRQSDGTPFRPGALVTEIEQRENSHGQDI